MLDQKVIEQNEKLRNSTQLVFRQTTGAFVKKTSILGSFAAVQTIIVIVLLIIDLVGINGGSSAYDSLLEKNGDDVTLIVDMNSMIVVRWELVVLQAVSILILWLNQYYDDIYLVTGPITFLAWVIAVFHCFYWIDTDKYEKLYYEASDDEPAKKLAYEWLDSCNVQIFANMAVLLLSLGINQKIQVDRECHHKNSPAFFKWVPKNSLPGAKNAAQIAHVEEKDEAVLTERQTEKPDIVGPNDEFGDVANDGDNEKKPFD